MNHIMMFKSPWLSLHHPLIVIMSLHVLEVYHPIHNTSCVSYISGRCPHSHFITKPLDFEPQSE